MTNPLNSLSAIAKVVGASNSSALALSVATWREIEGDKSEMQNVSFRFANESETATGAAYAAANFNDASPSTFAPLESSSSFFSSNFADFDSPCRPLVAVHHRLLHPRLHPYRSD